jgi:glycosyltransferase involved in cell wall biosynthesis
MPLVSVIIPMKNAEPYVREAMASVLSQPGVEMEVVVVDDGSTDRSVEIVRAIGDGRVRIVPGPRQGIAASFNAGLAAARGAYLARCDADDRYPPDRLAWQAAWLDAHADFVAVCGAFAPMNEKGRIVTERIVGDAAEVTDELRNGVGRSHLCSYMMRTDALRAIGGCRTFFTMSEDADLQYRLAEAGRVWYEPRVSYLYRLHDTSITHSRRETERLFFQRVALEFQQQRRASGQDDLQRGQPPQIPAATGDGNGVASAPTRSAYHIQSLLLGDAWGQHRAGRKGRALRTGLRACLASPTRVAGWKALAALALKRAGGEGNRQ